MHPFPNLYTEIITKWIIQENKYLLVQRRLNRKFKIDIVP